MPLSILTLKSHNTKA